MNNYAEIYTQHGLQEMINNSASRIRRLETERKDIGKTWTKEHIRSHQITIDKEIKDITEENQLIIEALNYRKSANLR